jgi:hypothetical protein
MHQLSRIVPHALWGNANEALPRLSLLNLLGACLPQAQAWSRLVHFLLRVSFSAPVSREVAHVQSLTHWNGTGTRNAGGIICASSLKPDFGVLSRRDTCCSETQF